MKYKIALLIDSIYDEYENKLWYELTENSKSRDIHLISFVGGSVHSPFEQNSRRNVIYRLIDEKNIDGIISFSATLGGYAPRSEFESFLSRFAPVPIVHIGAAPGDDPAILIDNETGMRQLMEHLLTVHKYRQIAFIRGPEDNPEAELRFTVYKKVLQKYGITVNEDLIVQGDFCRISGARAVAVLLDNRKIHFDCVAAANDYMAIDAMKELQNRGIRVPEDIAVVGFDDLQESSCLMHPLTTVKQSIHDIACRALEMILNFLAHNEFEHRITLPTKLVTRRSCGCFIELGNTNSGSSASSLYVTLLDEINSSLEESLDHDTKATWVNRLIRDFQESLALKNQKIFLVTLEDILIQSTQKAINILTWYPVISTLFSHNQNKYGNDDFFNLLWKGSLIVTGSLAKQAQAHIQIFRNLQNFQLRLLSEAFRNIFDTAKQKIFMEQYLPQLNIKSFYLGLHPAPDDLDHVTLLIAYPQHDTGVVTGSLMTSRELLDLAIHSSGKKKTLVIYPVYSDHEQLGIAIMEDGPRDGVIYESIGNQLNISVYEAKLFRQVQQQAEELAQQVEKRTRELKLLNRELELKNRIDGLTNLYNRTAIYEFLENKLTSQKVNKWINDRIVYDQCRRITDKKTGESNTGQLPVSGNAPAEEEALPFSLIMLDIDYFKKINDTYGHLFGDKVLCALSNILLSPDVFRKLDVTGRFGGEEFIVVLPETGTADARKAANRLKQRLDETLIEYNDNVKLTITVSMGIAESLDGDADNEDVIFRADMALYYAKQHGRNRIVIYSDVFK